MRGIRSLQLWIGILISAICLYLALRNVPLADLGHALAGASYLWLIPVIPLQFGAVVSRARRWAILLRRPGLTGDAFWAQGIGYLFTNIFPLRLGEVARVAVMARRSRLPIGQVAATAIVERVFDVATIVGLLALILPLMSVPSVVQRAGQLFGLAVLAIPIVLVGALRYQSQIDRLLERSLSGLRFLPANGLRERWREVMAGFASLADPRVVLETAGWSIVTWSCSVGTYWCALQMFNPHGALIEAAFMLVALALAVTVPSSPGFVGVFQYVGEQALVIPFGAKYDAPAALAITLTAYVSYYLFTTALGALALLRFRESFSDLGRLFAGRRDPVESTRVTPGLVGGPGT